MMYQASMTWFRIKDAKWPLKLAAIFQWQGVNTRALEELFAKSGERGGEIRDEISVSVLEIYCEQIRDLLSANVGGERLDIRQGEHGNYVPNLTVVPVTEIREVIELINLADKNRSTARHEKNLSLFFFLEMKAHDVIIESIC